MINTTKNGAPGEIRIPDQSNLQTKTIAFTNIDCLYTTLVAWRKMNRAELEKFLNFLCDMQSKDKINSINYLKEFATNTSIEESSIKNELIKHMKNCEVPSQSKSDGIEQLLMKYQDYVMDEHKEKRSDPLYFNPLLFYQH